jgi:hypothetical protein
MLTIFNWMGQMPIVEVEEHQLFGHPTIALYNGYAESSSLHGYPCIDFPHILPGKAGKNIFLRQINNETIPSHWKTSLPIWTLQDDPILV